MFFFWLQSKFSPEELAMRKEIVTQYWAEYERIKELAAVNYRSPAGRTTFDTGGVAAPIGSFENGAFTARARPVAGGGAFGGPVFGGWAVESVVEEEAAAMVRLSGKWSPTTSVPC